MHPTQRRAERVNTIHATCMDAHPRDGYFLVGTEDGLILIFKYSQEEAIQHTAIHNCITPSMNGISTTKYSIQSVKWNSEGSKFIVTDNMGYIAAYSFTVNDISLIFSQRVFDKGISACFIGETTFFAACGNTDQNGDVCIGNCLMNRPIVTRAQMKHVKAMCVVEQYNSLVVADTEGIKFVDIQTGRIWKSKLMDMNISTIEIDPFSIVLFLGLNDGRIVMSKIPDLNKIEDVGKHELKAKSLNLLRSFISDDYHAVNKLQLKWFDKNAQPELYSCSNDGSIIQRSLIYYQ